jgi:hypothetical protein
MSYNRRVLIILLYCALFFGVNTTGYSGLYPSSSLSEYAVNTGRDETGKYQSSVPDNGNTSFGGISLLLGLLMLYYVKKLADTRFRSDNNLE